MTTMGVRNVSGIVLMTAILAVALLFFFAVSQLVLQANEIEALKEQLLDKTNHVPLLPPPPQSRSPSPPHDGEEGWKNIAVFVGNRDVFDKSPSNYWGPAPPCYKPHSNAKEVGWCSQHGQDVAVSSLLRHKRDGFFVDLAANHPTFLSSTFSLERQFGWTGLCLEPNAEHWWGLTQGRTCRLVGAVIGQTTLDLIKFRVNDIDVVGGHGGIVAPGMDNAKAPDSDTKSFYTVTLQDVFRKFEIPSRIDYLSLDVEGAEDFIMSAFPFEEYSVALVSIERVSDSLKERMVRHGFGMVARLGGVDSLWVHESVRSELDPARVSHYATRLHQTDPKFLQ